MAVPTLVQSTGGDVVSGTSFTSPALAAPATAGNALVLAISGDKNTGALSGLPAGWTIAVQLTSASVSQYLAFGTAVGGETTVSCTLGATGGGSGNSGWLAELSQAGAGTWQQLATSAQHITDESTATVWATGTSGTASGDALGIGVLSCDSALNITAGSWSSSALTARYDTPVTGGTGGGGGSTHIGTAGVTSGGTLGSTWTTTSGGADQLSASLVVIGRGVAGPPTITTKVEVEFVPGSGTYVDLSALGRVAGTQIDRPRAVPGEDRVPATLTVDLWNYPQTTAGAGFGFCPFVPDSPGSVYYPNVARDRRIRVTYTSGATSWVRFLGFIDKWLPTMDENGATAATCQIVASDVLSRYARRRLLSYFGETVRVDPVVDYYPFDDPVDTASVRSISGDPVTYPARGAQIIAPKRPPGSATLQSPDGGHLMDGQISFSRGNDNAPSPVVLIPMRSDAATGGMIRIRQVSASFRLSTDPAGGSDDVISAYSNSGDLRWRWSASLVAGNIIWNLYDVLGVARSFYDTGAPRDDSWHHWTISFPTATSSNLRLVEKGGASTVVGSFAWPAFPFPDPGYVAYLVIGGQMPPRSLGKNTNTLQGDVSSLLVQYDTGSIFAYQEFGVPGITSDASRVATFLNAQGTGLNTLTGGSITPGSGTDFRQLMYTNATNNLLDRWNEHARTTGGQFTVLPDGRRRYIVADDARPLTVALTLDAVDDLDMPSGGWVGAQEERPTRVYAVGPVGAVTFTDTATEAVIGMTLEGPTVQTSAGDVDLATSVAAYVMGGTATRLSQFGVDFTLTGTDKTATAMALRIGDRMRITGLPSEYVGLTFQDVYASGWSEICIGGTKSCVFIFDTDPADDPPEGILDNAEYGRTAWGDGIATVTGGSCVGTTTTGTVIITCSTPGSTVAGDYPVDLLWNGERITVTAPGGGTSPQTFPVTVRGVAPTVARIHAAGETVDVWHAATATL